MHSFEKVWTQDDCVFLTHGDTTYAVRSLGTLQVATTGPAGAFSVSAYPAYNKHEKAWVFQRGQWFVAGTQDPVPVDEARILSLIYETMRPLAELLAVNKGGVAKII